MPPSRSPLFAAFFFFLLLLLDPSLAQFKLGDGVAGAGSGGGGAGGGAGEGAGEGGVDAPPPPGLETCDGVYISYTFNGRTKEYPKVKNASAQAYSFKASATVLNAMTTDLKEWKLFVGFQHREILVSVDGAVVVDGSDFPVNVENGTTLMGYPMTDLKNSIDTAGDIDQIQVKVDIVGTQFGLKGKAIPMPKKLELVNDGIKCPKATSKGGFMSACCKRDPKAKKKVIKPVKFLPLQYGDLNMMYDVMTTYGNNYQAQVTIDNLSPLGRLDNWNLTWEWKRGEFINSMKGAYTYKKGGTECLYGDQGKYYTDFDFSTIQNCERKPVITDLPPEFEKDDKIGNVPNCCKNGTLLPPVMTSSQSQSIFQLNVFKIPPDMNRTALSPPQNWKIVGVVNPHYVCGPPRRVTPSEFPDDSGLLSSTYAIASWQVVCNITRPKAKAAKCCVSFSAFFNESAIPCNTCACGCSEEDTCNQNARPVLLPAEALLIPAVNRTKKAQAWAELQHLAFPKRLPCVDNCGVSINWHVQTDHQKGWSARVTLFNWGDYTFKDWFTAVRIPKAYSGYENVYSFNGTRLPELNKTIFFNGLPGLTYLMPVKEGKDSQPRSDYKVPGKLQSVISFVKKHTPGIDIKKGDGFPTRVYFNGEECALPDHLPISTSGAVYQVKLGLLLPMALMSVVLFALNM